MHEICRVWEIKKNKLTSSQLIHQDLITFNFQIITIITIFWIISFIYEIYSRQNNKRKSDSYVYVFSMEILFNKV